MHLYALMYFFDKKKNNIQYWSIVKRPAKGVFSPKLLYCGQKFNE